MNGRNSDNTLIQRAAGLGAVDLAGDGMAATYKWIHGEMAPDEERVLQPTA